MPARWVRYLSFIGVAWPLLWLGGCRSLVSYRYVDLREPPNAAKSRVVTELEKAGYLVRDQSDARQHRLIAVHAPSRPATPGTPVKPRSGFKVQVPPPAPDRAPVEKPPAARQRGDAKAPVDPKRWKKPELQITLHPRGKGSRVEIWSERRSALKALFQDQKHQDYSVAFGLNGRRLFWELYGMEGYRYAPGYRHSLAIDAGGRIGYWFDTLGRVPERPVFKARVGLAAGLGGGWSSQDEAGYALPSVTFSLLLRRAVAPVPGRLIPIGPEFHVDLHAVGVLGLERRGIETQLVFRYSDVIGFYVGGGYQWEPTKGATFTAGLYFSTVGVATAALIGLIALAY